MKTSVQLAIVTSLWACACVAGLSWASIYHATPGAEIAGPSHWPQAALGPQQRTTALAIVHPQCPCTRASIAELTQLAHKRDWALGIIVFQPVKQSQWALPETYEQLDADFIYHDAGGVLAQQLGSSTSGTMLVYDAHGALRFQGGLTPSRGHRGITPAHAAFEHSVQVFSTNDIQSHAFPVFGCSLTPARMPHL